MDKGIYEYKGNSYAVGGVCCISKGSDNRQGVFYVSTDGKAYARGYQDFKAKFKKVDDLQVSVIGNRCCKIKTDDGWVEGFTRTIKTEDGDHLVTSFMPTGNEFSEIKEILQEPSRYDHFDLVAAIYDLAAIVDVADRKGLLEEFEGW